MVRIPPNGGEMNQFLAKQVLDSSVYGVIWPHVSTVEEARNAVADYKEHGDRYMHRTTVKGDTPFR